MTLLRTNRLQLLMMVTAMALIILVNLNPHTAGLTSVGHSHRLGILSASSAIGGFSWVQASAGLACGIGAVALLAAIPIPGGVLGAAGAASTVAAACVCAFAC